MVEELLLQGVEKDVKNLPHKFALQKHQIIQKRNKLDSLFNVGKRHHSKWVSLIINPHPIGRVGFVAGKKLGTAPQRSTCKRYLKEWFRLHQHHILPTVDIVFCAKK